MRLGFSNYTKIAIGHFRTSLTNAQSIKRLSTSHVPRRETKSVVAWLDPCYSYRQQWVDRHSPGNRTIICLRSSSVLAENF